MIDEPVHHDNIDSSPTDIPRILTKWLNINPSNNWTHNPNHQPLKKIPHTLTNQVRCGSCLCIIIVYSNIDRFADREYTSKYSHINVIQAWRSSSQTKSFSIAASLGDSTEQKPKGYFQSVGWSLKRGQQSRLPKRALLLPCMGQGPFKVVNRWKDMVYRQTFAKNAAV